jgi:NAD-dependent SIR2 family protein deacetylase
VRPRTDTFRSLARLLRGRRTVVLSGAGVSTESGIPDYRRPDGTRRNPDPMRHRQFTGDAEARRRYWARSAVGWPRFRAAQPNDGHRALARLEETGCVTGVITQNVDRLHQQGGSRRVVDLHGTLEEVRCLACEDISSRDALQEQMLAANPGFPPGDATLKPDGDAVLPEGAHERFAVPACAGCGGTLMPDVVFFGGSVPETRVEAAWQLYEDAEVLLVVGSSLAVYSGYRFALRARKEGRPIAVLNLGPTRGPAAVRHEARLGTALPKLARALTGRARPVRSVRGA